MSIELENNNKCFACGGDNSIGLQLSFFEEDGVYKTRFTPDEAYQSFRGIMHGGITSTILDEVMGKYLTDQGISAMTVQLEVRFKKAIKIGQEILAEGKIVNIKGRIIDMKAAIFLEDGSIAASAKAKFMKVK